MTGQNWLKFFHHAFSRGFLQAVCKWRILQLFLLLQILNLRFKWFFNVVGNYSCLYLWLSFLEVLLWQIFCDFEGVANFLIFFLAELVLAIGHVIWKLIEINVCLFSSQRVRSLLLLLLKFLYGDPVLYLLKSCAWRTRACTVPVKAHVTEEIVVSKVIRDQLLCELFLFRIVSGCRFLFCDLYSVLELVTPSSWLSWLRR